MNFLKEITDKTLLIVDNDMKDKVLENINLETNLINVKVMTKLEFLKHYFFDYNEEAVYYVSRKYQTTISNAKIYLDNIKYVLNCKSKNEKVIFLNTIYEELKNNNLLILDSYFKDYLKTIQVKVLVTSKLEPFMINIFDSINASYVNYKEDETNYKPNIYHFKNIDEEVEYVFNQISTLIKDGVSLNKIKIISLGSEYDSYLKRLSKLYNINMNGLNSPSIYGCECSKKIINMINSGKTKNEINEYLNKHSSKDIYNIIFNILNKYYFVDDLRLVLDEIKLDFKKKKLKKHDYLEAIDLIDLNSYLIDDTNFVFLIGFNLEHIPNTYKDIDYLNDNLKENLGLFTSYNQNINEREKCLYHLKHIKNLVITYKDLDPYNTYAPSNLVEELGNILEIENIENNTSNLYNKIKLVKNLDAMLKYGVKENNTNILYNTYSDIPYLTYDNKFTGIDLEKEHRTLSFTSLNTFYHCKFRFYIENILKLNIYEDSFKTYIGSLFHYVLSKMFDDDFDYLKEYENYIKEREFSLKEKFYLEILKEELLKIIEIIKNQHNLTGLNDLKLEQEIKLDYNETDSFKGFIDKIMYKEKDGNTYISVVDYKTGTPKLDMTNAIYGIDMQLPVYAYLIKKGNIFLNPKIIGFYFEQITREIPSYDRKKSLEEQRLENTKLQGYSINDTSLVELFDSTYENSSMIKSMRVGKNGNFYQSAKVLSEEEIDNLVNLVDFKIKEAFNDIKAGEFTIDPKVIGGDMVGCLYCKYQDLCYKTGNDIVYLEKHNDFSYLGGSEDAKVD